jgi:hypothetical protein
MAYTMEKLLSVLHPCCPAKDGVIGRRLVNS